MKKVLITGKGSYVGTAVERRMAEEPDSFSVDVIGTRDGEWRDVDFFSYDSVFHVAGIAMFRRPRNPTTGTCRLTASWLWKLLGRRRRPE